MNPPLHIRIYHRRVLCHTTLLKDEIQIGRQRPGEGEPFYSDEATGRLVVAPIDDKLVSREHLLLRSVSADDGRPQIEVRNLSKKRSVFIEAHGKLGPEESTQINLPVLISFEEFAVRVELVAAIDWETRSLEHPTLAPGTRSAHIGSGSMGSGSMGSGLIGSRSILQVAAQEKYSSEQLMHWLGETMEVLQSAAGAPDFLAQSVDAVDRIVGLDAISALRYSEGKWSIDAAKEMPSDGIGSDSRSPSRTILQEVLDRKCTIYHLPAGSAATASLQGIRALVASPILNTAGEVIGALYGARFGRETAQLPQISALEATLVEVIACSAAAGIARELQQQKALQARIQFEQFFTPELARELELNPDLLDGQDADVSILFCDIVSFSTISGRIGSQLTMHWIGEVMDTLSDAVMRHQGVVVDYIGDALMAMWGAPKPQPDHASKSCLAANEMMHCKSQIDRLWLAKTGQPIDFRIGIYSGVASVGNTGSKRRLKYGPLGNTVNLASRLQSAAKFFGVRQLVGHTTASSISSGSGLVCRPLGTTQMVNIPSPVPIYELGEQNGSFPQLALRFGQLMQAIQDFDKPTAQTILSGLLAEFPDDLPTRMLHERLQANQSLDPHCLWLLDTK